MTALANLKRIARALWDIRNPPMWTVEEKERHDRRRYVADLGRRRAAQKTKALYALHLRRQGLKWHEVGHRMGLCGQSARNWAWRGERLEQNHHTVNNV